jgi:tetratricopeptide (TPR) repeat protein
VKAIKSLRELPSAKSSQPIGAASKREIADLQPILSRSRDFPSIFYLGIYWYEQGDYEGALACYDEILRHYLGSPETFSNKGGALNKLGRYEEALEALDRALQIRPDYAQALNNKGATLSDLGRYEEAIEIFDRALRINPNYAEAFYNKGEALLKLGRPEDGRNAEKRTYTTIKTDPPAAQIPVAWIDSETRATGGKDAEDGSSARNPTQGARRGAEHPLGGPPDGHRAQHHKEVP